MTPFRLPALALAVALTAAAQGCGERSPEPDVTHAPSDPHGRPNIPGPSELAHLPKDGGPQWNRLVFEKSPYLLQHAANPVDWYPWGDEAFETARRLDKPVFLSVGYATCHWCHVMERECFEDAEVAKLLDDTFVCVKVDREERPDIDHVYMTVTQALTGQGGWPMTVVLTPDKQAFFAGTYFPKRGRPGRPGLMDLVPKIADAWTSGRDHVLQDARRITDALRSMQGAPAAEGAKEPGEEALQEGADQLEVRFDPRHGGFGRAPKFPTPHQLSFLLRRHARGGDEHALAMVEKTLVEMRAGGIFDQVGFGFHRYSTDERWLVPHFEKMLYDQALVVIAASECFAVTRDERYARMADETVAYVLRDLASGEGAFHCAEDADSEGEEGRFYVWTRAQLDEALGADAAFAARAWGVEDAGNFADEATGRRTGANILHRTEEDDETAQALGMSVEAFREKLEGVRRRLLEARSHRVRPLLDDKVLTDWNGLMIAALAISARTLDRPDHERAARRAADAVLGKLVTPEGRCLKRMRHGEAGLPGMLDDHAFLAWGLLELYETTLDARWLEASLRITRAMIEHFEDPRGGFYLSPDDGEALPARGKEAYDGATPSGNSVAALVLVKLSRLLGDAPLEEHARGVMRAFGGGIAQAPSAHGFLLMALDAMLAPGHEIVIVGDPSKDDTRALVAVTRARFRPNDVVLLRSDAIARLAPFTTSMTPLDGRAAAYVCTDHACQAPVSSPDALAKALENASARPLDGAR